MHITLGWEYCVEPGIGVWVPYEKNTHFSRRRRWVRTRIRTMDAETMKKKQVSLFKTSRLVIVINYYRLNLIKLARKVGNMLVSIIKRITVRNIKWIWLVEDAGLGK